MIVRTFWNTDEQWQIFDVYICVYTSSHQISVNALKKTSHWADRNASRQSGPLEGLKQSPSNKWWNTAAEISSLLLTIAWGPTEGGREKHVQGKRTRRKRRLETNKQVPLWEEQQLSPWIQLFCTCKQIITQQGFTVELHLHVFILDCL